MIEGHDQVVLAYRSNVETLDKMLSVCSMTIICDVCCSEHKNCVLYNLLNLIIVRTVIRFEPGIGPHMIELCVSALSKRTCVLSCSEEVGHDSLVIDGPSCLVSQGIECFE
jgi:hypothetical protein